MEERSFSEVRILDLEGSVGDERRLELLWREEQVGYALYEPAACNYYPSYEGPFFHPDLGGDILFLKALSVDVVGRELAGAAGHLRLPVRAGEAALLRVSARKAGRALPPPLQGLLLLLSCARTPCGASLARAV